MTLSTLEKQIERLEEKISSQPGGSVSLWIAGLLKAPEENELILDAASLLILEDVLDEPAPHLWKRLASRFDVASFESWPNVRTLFAAASQELAGENFDDDEAKETLVYLARVYYDVFHVEAPPPSEEREQAKHEEALDELFLRPLLARACPQSDALGSEARQSWLQKMQDAPEEPESSLAVLREFVQEIQQKQATP